MIVRLENKEDNRAVFELNTLAFGQPGEAALVEALREQAAPSISLVAQSGESIVGHILLTPVTLEGHPDLNLMAIGPMAVLPGYQRKGIGSALVKAALDDAKQSSIDAVFVLGHPEYYPRFGFAPAAAFGIDSDYEAPIEAFMVLELRPDVLVGRSGRLKYHPAFAEI